MTDWAVTRGERPPGAGTRTVAPDASPSAPLTADSAPPARITLGFLPPLILLAAGALVAVVLADGASRAGETWGVWVFWLALFGAAIPFAYRLADSRPGRAERIGLVIVFGLFLYFVKVLRDPSGFAYSDELAHSYNVNQIATTHGLFGENPILPLTSRYPGLGAGTAAFRMSGGVSTFVAGITMIGLARLLMMLVLFLLFELLSGSARLGGFAALIYTANANFVFFSGQFSYESLALPLAVVATYAALRWLNLREASLDPHAKRRLLPSLLVWPRGQPRREAVKRTDADRAGRGWAIVAVAMIAAVVVTHHLTAYALALLLFAIARAQREIRRLWTNYVTPVRFALFASLGTLVWFLFLAQSTWNYLSPVVSDAVKSALDIFGGHAAARGLFSSGQHTLNTTPFADRALALAAAVLTAVGLPFGLWGAWKRHRTNPAYVVLGLAGAIYVLSLGLRLVPDAWEIANRASEFLFLGVGLVLATVGLERWRPRFAPRLGQVTVSIFFSILLAGGIIAGWSADLLLAQAYNTAGQGSTLHPQGIAATRWARDVLGPQKRFAADASNARLLAVYADEFAMAGTHPDLRAVIRDPRVDAWHLRLLHQQRIRYVLVDKRLISEDALAGYFFATRNTPKSWLQNFEATSVHKYDHQPAVSRLFDSGNIVVYDVGKLVRHAS